MHSTTQETSVRQIDVRHRLRRLASLVGVLRALQNSVLDLYNGTALLKQTDTNQHIPIRMLPAVNRRIRREVGSIHQWFVCYTK